MKQNVGEMEAFSKSPILVKTRILCPTPRSRKPQDANVFALRDYRIK
jgi:hypothetical protein